MRFYLIIYTVAVILLGTAHHATAEASGTSENQLITSGQVEQLSAKEKEWFDVFQKGTLFARGWQEITRDILATTPQELREKQKIALEKLGRKIGYEWAKDNTVRRIDTQMLKKWGQLLSKTAGENPEHLKKVIVEIDQKVALLLN